MSLPRNVFFGFVSWILPLALSLISTPIVVHGLGTTEYGLFALILGFVGYSINFNVSRGVTKYISEYRATKQTEKINETIAATLIVSILVGLSGALLIAGLANYLVIDVLQIESSSQQRAIYALYLAAGTVCLTIISQAFSAIVQAVLRFDVYSHITTATGLLLVAGNIVLVLSGFGILHLLAWNLIVVFLGGLAFIWAARKLLPEARFSLVSSKETIRLIFKFGFSVTSGMLFVNFYYLFERGWITRHLGSEALAYFAVSLTVALNIHLFSYSLLMVLFPLTSEIGAQENKARLRSIFHRATKYIAAMVVFMGVTLCVCGHEILRLWLGQVFADKTTNILIIQTITFGSLAIGIAAWQVIEGLGHPERNAWFSILVVIIGIPLIFILTPQFGLEGVGAAKMFWAILIYVYILLVEKWAWKNIEWRFWLKTFVVLLLAGTICGLLEFTWLNYFWSGSLGLLSVVCIAGICYLGILLITDFINKDERIWWESLISKSIPRLRTNN
jgi:O-antigen/teichoic acid export membrane protein